MDPFAVCCMLFIVVLICFMMLLWIVYITAYLCIKLNSGSCPLILMGDICRDTMDNWGFGVSSEPLGEAAGDYESVVIIVDGMSCQSCVQTIEDNMRVKPGVQNIVVTLLIFWKEPFDLFLGQFTLGQTACSCESYVFLFFLSFAHPNWDSVLRVCDLSPIQAVKIWLIIISLL